VGRVDLDALWDAAVSMSDGRTAVHEYCAVDTDGTCGGLRHHDGWGLAFGGTSGRVKCLRGLGAIGTHARPNPAAGSRTAVCVVHVRNASVASQRGVAYVHPIECRVRGRTAYFFHNGFAPDVGPLLTDPPSDWDSENLCRWLSPAFEATFPEPLLLERLDQLPPSTTAANCIVLEHDRLTVCNWFSPRTTTPEYYTMYVCNVGDARVVASERLQSIAPYEAWEPLGSGRVLQFDLARLIRT
jgi:predicted glutamine amidotransferase